MKKLSLVLLLLIGFLALPIRSNAQTYAIGIYPGSPSSLSFAAVLGAAPPVSQMTVVIATPATALPVAVTSDQPWLTVSSDSTTTKVTVTVSVSSVGLSVGMYSGNVVITNTNETASDSPFKVPVSLLVGAQSTPHTVSLAWAQSGTVAGFNLYRSTCTTPQQTSSGSSPGACNSGPVPTLLTAINDPSAASYVDSAVLPGTSYEYYITSFNSSGVESGKSNLVVATVGPSAASGLKVTSQN